MARKRVVSRTIITADIEVLCLDLEKQEPFHQVVSIPSAPVDEDKCFALASEIINTDTVKCVHITSITRNESLYVMDEKTFIEHAEKLPPRDTNNEKE